MSRLTKLGVAAVVASLCIAGAIRLHAADEKPVAAAAAAPKPAANRVFEMRTYHPAAGKMDALHARFRDHTNKLLEKHGATLIGHWVTLPPKDKPDAPADLVWILAYPSMEAREKTWKDFQADPDWVKAKAESEKNGVLVTKADVVFLAPADYSPLK